MKSLAVFILVVPLSAPVLGASTCSDLPLGLQRDHCERMDRVYQRAVARLEGAPVPSAETVRLPAYGTKEAAAVGYACMDGIAMRRLPNGWEQVRNARHENLRCYSD